MGRLSFPPAPPPHRPRPFVEVQQTAFFFVKSRVYKGFECVEVHIRSLTAKTKPGNNRGRLLKIGELFPGLAFVPRWSPSILTDKHCKNAQCPTDKKRARFTDAGGLYLEVSPAGSTRWFWKAYADGKEGRLALGAYPAMGLSDARKARDAAKLHKSEGRDPVQVRKLEKIRAARPEGDTFKAVALEWYAKQAPQWSTSHADRSLRQLERDLFPWIGARPIAEIHAMELLAALQKVEERGALEIADRLLMLARQI